MAAPARPSAESAAKAAVFDVRNSPAVLARMPLRSAEACANSRDTDGLLREGMFVASRQAGVPARPGEPLSLLATRRAYNLRSRWRPTPHGAFAGITAVRTAGRGEPAHLQLGAVHRARTVPSGTWLSAVADTLVADWGVLRRLRLTACNLVTQRGSLLEHEWRARRVTARATQAVLFVMHRCTGGATTVDVIEEVTRRWPVPESAAAAMLIALVAGGFLLTDLLPLDIRSDPLGHLVGRLAHDDPRRAPLHRLRELLAEADKRPAGDPARLGALMRARDAADAICQVDRPLTVDVAAEASVVVPSSLLREAARAASVLWQVTDYPHPLEEWHEQFARRYGPGRLVPLLDATDPAIGLGLDTVGAGLQAPEPDGGSSRRNQALWSLAAWALSRGETEVVLDEATIAELASNDLRRTPPETAEIAVRVLRSGNGDFSASGWQLAVVPPGPEQAGAAIGRFADLLDAWPGKAETSNGTLTAEIIPRPRVPGCAALAVPAGVEASRIPVGVPPQDGDLQLADLCLVSDGRYLRCWSGSRQHFVRPVLYSRLAPHLLPPLARFLQLLGSAGKRPFRQWTWGLASTGPYQPRVRYGRTILSPARWTLPPALVQAAGNQAQWHAALDAWRAAAVPAPPDIVDTDDADLRLPLELNRADDRELLRRYTRRGLRAVLEPPGGTPSAQAVLKSREGRHVLDLIVPLQARHGDNPAIRPSLALAARPNSAADRQFQPGGPWLCLVVKAPVTCQDQVLVKLAALGDLVDEHADAWFWLRYADRHGPHLRIRFHGDPVMINGRLLPALSAWCGDLIRCRLSGGFSIEPYERETERYGGPTAIEYAERVFTTDSQLALEMLTTTADPEQRLVAASMSAVAIIQAVAGDDDDALRRPHLDRADRRRFEALRPATRSLLRRGEEAPVMFASDPGSALWAVRNRALREYQAVVKPAWRAGVARALAHMHANRLLGDANAERIVTALAADLLQLAQARRRRP